MWTNFQQASDCVPREMGGAALLLSECQYEAMRGRSNTKLGDHLRGKAQSPEHREKRIESIRRTYAAGEVEHARVNLGLRREQTTQWKGDQIGYRAAHARLYAERGRPTGCELCGTKLVLPSGRSGRTQPT